MSPEEKHELQYRAKRAVSAPVPQSVLDGSAQAAANYKQCAAVVGAYLRTGHQVERARLHLLRLEGVQGLLP